MVRGFDDIVFDRVDTGLGIAFAAAIGEPVSEANAREEGDVADRLFAPTILYGVGVASW